MNNFVHINNFLQAGGDPSGQLVWTFLTFGVVILIFYFLIIRPQNKKQKETEKMLSSIKKGDRVATIGGIRGVVQSVKNDTVILKVDDNTKMEFGKNAVSSILEEKKEKKKDSEEIEEKSEQEAEKE